MVESDQIQNETSAKDPNTGAVDDELRPFSDIKNKIEDVIDEVVRKNFHGKSYEAK